MLIIPTDCGCVDMLLDGLLDTLKSRHGVAFIQHVVVTPPSSFISWPRPDYQLANWMYWGDI